MSVVWLSKSTLLYTTNNLQNYLNYDRCLKALARNFISRSMEANYFTKLPNISNIVPKIYIFDDLKIGKRYLNRPILIQLLTVA